MELNFNIADLKDIAQFFIFTFDDENGTVDLMVDCNENIFVPLPAGYFLKDESKNISYQYTGITEIVLPDYWVDEKEILGSWSITTPDSDWRIQMDSDEMDYFDEGNGDLSSDKMNFLLSRITNKSLFTIVTDFIEKSR